MASSSVYPDIGFTKLFPLLGFPNESNKIAGEVVYQAHWWSVRIAVWRRNKGLTQKGSYGVNLYHAHYTDNTLTHAQDRYSYNQSPILVEDAFEAQLAINYLIQKHLPTEVINDICYAGAERQDAGEGNTIPAEDQAREDRADCTAGEAVE